VWRLEPSVEQLAVHYASDGCLLHASSEDGQRQLAANKAAADAATAAAAAPPAKANARPSLDNLRHMHCPTRSACVDAALLLTPYVLWSSVVVVLPRSALAKERLTACNGHALAHASCEVSVCA